MIALITIVTKVTLSETPSVVTLLEKRELDPGGQVCLLVHVVVSCRGNEIPDFRLVQD